MKKLFPLITLLITAIGINSLKAQILYVPSGTAGIGTSTVAGNIGIGTTTPPYKLTVSNAGGLGLEFDPSGVQYNEGFGMQVYNRSTSSYQPLQIYASKILLNGGNVGIGTTTPENKLVITGGTTRIDGSYKLAFGSSNGGLHAINASSATAVGTLDFTQFMGSGWRTTMSLDAATGNVGIGTTTPATSLDVVRRSLGQLAKFSEHPDQVVINGESYISVGYSPINLGYHYVSGDSYGFLEMNGGSRAIVVKKNGNVGIGTTNPQYKLAVEGTIAAREVKVTAESWADFVFHPTYKLRTLGEVEQFIKTNSHLPEIPTAAEVKENGVSLGEMNAKLLQKVEELTLYLIEQQKVNEKQNQLIKMLEQKIEKITTRQ